LFIDLALDLVEFFFAILDGEKGEPRAFGEKVPHIEDRVAGDETAADY